MHAGAIVTEDWQPESSVGVHGPRLGPKPSEDGEAGAGSMQGRGVTSREGEHVQPPAAQAQPCSCKEPFTRLHHINMHIAHTCAYPHNHARHTLLTHARDARLHCTLLCTPAVCMHAGKSWCCACVHATYVPTCRGHKSTRARAEGHLRSSLGSEVRSQRLQEPAGVVASQLLTSGTFRTCPRHRGDHGRHPAGGFREQHHAEPCFWAFAVAEERPLPIWGRKEGVAGHPTTNTRAAAEGGARPAPAPCGGGSRSRTCLS